MTPADLFALIVAGFLGVIAGLALLSAAAFLGYLFWLVVVARILNWTESR